MALINKLKAIGDAIRSKTGKTDSLTLEQMVSEIGSIQTGGSGSGGDSSGVISGSFTPTEDTLSVTIDIGSYPEHFLLYSNDDLLGKGFKVGNGLIVDRTLPYAFLTSSNITGSSYTTGGQTSVYNETSQIFTVNNTRIAFADNEITISTSTASGASFAYFLAGVTYTWYAW